MHTEKYVYPVCSTLLDMPNNQVILYRVIRIVLVNPFS